jgi:hypothetical protein
MIFKKGEPPCKINAYGKVQRNPTKKRDVHRYPSTIPGFIMGLNLKTPAAFQFADMSVNSKAIAPGRRL